MQISFDWFQIIELQAAGQHVNLCELKIQTIKRRIFKLMRIKKTSNWAYHLPKIVDNINKTPSEGIGFLRPFDVQDSDSDIIIQDRLRSIGKYKEPFDVQKQKRLLQEFLKKKSNKKFSPGSYVVIDFNLEGRFEKFTSLKVSTPIPYFERALCKNTALCRNRTASKNHSYKR